MPSLQDPLDSRHAIFISRGSEELKFRVGTPSKEVLEMGKLRWADGMITDHEGFVVTPSSPVLKPGVYEYVCPLPSKFCIPSVILVHGLAGCQSCSCKSCLASFTSVHSMVCCVRCNVAACNDILLSIMSGPSLSCLVLRCMI